MLNYLGMFRHFSRDIRLFLLSTFFIGFGFMGIQGVMFNLYLVRLGFGTEEIGLVLGMGQLAHAALCLPAGALGTRWGNRRLLIAGALISGSGFGLMPVTEVIPEAAQFAWIAFAQICVWVGATLYIVNVGPFLMAVSEPAMRTRVFAARAAIQPVAGISGSLFAGWFPAVLVHYTGTTADDSSVYGITLLVAMGSLSFAAWLQANAKWSRELGVRTETATPSILPAPYALIAVMGLITLLRAIGEGAGRSFFNVYLDTTLLMPTATIGALIATGQVLSFPVSLAMPSLVQRWGLGRAAVTGLLGVALSLLPMALLPTVAAASLGYMSLSTWSSLNNPVFVMYTQGLVPSYWGSFMSGAMAMSAAVGIALISIIGGRMIETQGYTGFWLLASLLTVCGSLLLLASQYYMRNRPHLAAPSG